MKTIHTIAYALLVLALPVALFVATPFVTVTNAQWDDYSDYGSYFDSGYGTSGGDLYSLFDYSSYDGGNSNFTYTDYNSYYDSGYGVSGGGVIDNGCCDSYTYSVPANDYTYTDYDSYYDSGYGVSGGDVIDNGCCDEQIAYAPIQTQYSQPEYFEQEYVPYTYANDTYSYVYPSYQYSYPNYNYGNYMYPRYTYSGTGSTYTYVPTTPYTPAPSLPPVGSRPTCTLTVSDDVIDEDEDATLRWTTSSNATSVSINNGIGSVSRNGSRVVSPNNTVTYTLTATNSHGSVTCSETIRVEEDNDNDDNVRCDSFTASDTTVDDGDYVTLRWRTTDANDVDINQGVGDVEEDGDERVRITRDTTFTLTARDGNDTDTCRVTVRVDDEDNNSSAPRCVFNVSDSEAFVGQNLLFSWENERTDRLILKDGNGKEIVDTDDTDRVNEDRGGIQVTATKAMTYTLTVYNGNVRRTCTLDITIDKEKRGGISLSQVPYTGFDAGPVLTTIFYTAIVLWGLFLAYVLVLRQNAKKKSMVATYQRYK